MGPGQEVGHPGLFFALPAPAGVAVGQINARHDEPRGADHRNTPFVSVGPVAPLLVEHLDRESRPHRCAGVALARRGIPVDVPARRFAVGRCELCGSALDLLQQQNLRTDGCNGVEHALAQRLAQSVEVPGGHTHGRSGAGFSVGWIRGSIHELDDRDFAIFFGAPDQHRTALVLAGLGVGPKPRLALETNTAP